MKIKNINTKKAVESLTAENIYGYIYPLMKNNQKMFISFEKIKEMFEKGLIKLEEEKTIKRIKGIPPEIEDISCFWFLAAPFFSEFLLRFNYYETESIGTIGVNIIINKMNMFINPKFFYPLDFETRQGILMHEIMHFINNTFQRAKNIPDCNHQIFNIASDIPINEEVIKTTIAKKSCKIPDTGFFEKNILKHTLTVDKIDDNAEVGKTLNVIQKKDNEKVASGKITEININEIAVTLINHINFNIDDMLEIEDNSGDGQGNGESDGDGDGHGQGNGESDGDGHAIGELSDESIEYVKEIIKVAKMRGYGKVSNNMQESIEKIIKPQVYWKKELKKFISKIMFSGNIKQDSWTRKNRRSLPLPGKKKISSEIVIAIDTSGSIGSDYFEMFFSEIESIAKTHKVSIIEFDCEIKKEKYEYKKGDWRKVKLKGGGGTNIQPIFEYIIKEKLNKNVIIFTDGEFSYNFNTHGINTLFCVVDNEKITVPKGKNVHIKK